VVTMPPNKVNAQNPAFFADLHAAFDRLEAEFNDCAVVLTGSGAVFTAGLDFDHHFPLFARRSLREIDAYRATNLRLFTVPKADCGGNQRPRLRWRADNCARL
jgi:enoyl-CoA hydratase/carnithine racemase